MTCSCNICPNFFKVTSITASDTAVTITADRTTTLTSEQPICFAICTAIPTLTSTLPVNLVIGSTTIALKDRSGENLVAGQLRNRILYRGFYGSTGPQLVIQNMPRIIVCNRYS